VSVEVGLLGSLLPDRVGWAEAAVPDASADGAAVARIKTIEAGLFPEEREHIAHAVVKRRAEFAAVRHCARQALRDIGFPPVPILPGEQREPIWPEGVVGSMTHCAGYCAAAVARAGDVETLGIDAELHAPLPEGVLDLVSLETERERMAGLAAHASAEVHWDRVLFSAKESVYKAWFPLTRLWLGFDEADIDLRPDGSFTARLQPATADPATVPRGFVGRWAVSGELTATAIGEVVR
jgi:4'-phosphopantetheinyl transferase EntD